MVRIHQTIIEKIPSVRWYIYQNISKFVYAKAFRKFGEKSIIISPLILKGLDRISIGANVYIGEGAWIQAEDSGDITVYNDIFIGHRTHIHSVSPIKINSGVTIADSVTLTNGSHDLDDLDLITQTGEITLGTSCFIGEKAIVLGGVTVGERSIVGAGAVVTKDVPPGTTVVGVPAKPLKKDSK